MYIGEKYKEGMIYQSNGTVFLKIRCRSTATDESIYETLKSLTPLIELKQPLYRINTVFKNLLDEAPLQDEEARPEGATFEDSELIVPKNVDILENIIFTDQEIYGENFDGEKRKYRILWVDAAGKEQFVPLENIDTFKAVNPHGAYSYNSETKELIFSAFMPYETRYILRKYYYDE